MPEQLQPNEYRCALCGNVYEKEWADEEAMAEMQEHWPKVSQEDCGMVCDDCWQKIRPDRKKSPFEEYLERWARK